MEVPSARLFVTGAVVTLGGSFHFGYSLSLINPTVEIFENFLNRSMHDHYGWRLNNIASRFLWSTIAGFLLLGAAVGAVIIMPAIIDKYGRKMGLIISSIVLAISFPISGLSKLPDYIEMFAAGRLLCGIGVGMAMGCQAVYLTEISPVKYRGFVGMMIGCAVEIGFTCGNFFGLPYLLGTEDRWPYMLYVELIPTFILLVFLITAKETPNFLLIKSNTKAALESLIYYHGAETDTATTMKMIEEDVHMQESQLSIWQVWRERPVRNAAILSMLINVAVSFSGIMAISYFGVFLLETIGFDNNTASLANAGAGAFSILSSVAGTFLVEKTGRKKLVMFSMIGLTVLDTLMMVLVIVFDATKATILGYFFIVFLASFLFVFGCGIGCIAWFLGSELAPQHARSSVQSLGISAQYIGSFISPVIYFPLESLVGPYSFLLFIIPLILITVYFYFYLPETKNREIRDIMADLGGTEKQFSAAAVRPVEL
uniref:Major facilitator superfamily (MFS) profile domain-containing protein n=1 Tax=Plectus sambesii TaxID=2011161 RepID=A0A914VYZ6_9BILA